MRSSTSERYQVGEQVEVRTRAEWVRGVVVEGKRDSLVKVNLETTVPHAFGPRSVIVAPHTSKNIRRPLRGH